MGRGILVIDLCQKLQLAQCHGEILCHETLFRFRKVPVPLLDLLPTQPIAMLAFERRTIPQIGSRSDKENLCSPSSCDVDNPRHVVAIMREHLLLQFLVPFIILRTNRLIEDRIHFPVELRPFRRLGLFFHNP